MSSSIKKKVSPKTTLIDLTIDQVKPYDKNPRKTRNPRYDEIKLSILKRGLDNPPIISRRPEESHYIILKGGNTRLSILHELWQETQDERFFKITWRFQEWIDEIQALTGHLVEDLHSGLTFIDRAISVIDALKIYREQQGKTITQKQLAEKLTNDGYPISQTRISQMHETVNYLLPIIPNCLYAGLSRTKVENILRFRKNAKSIWEKYSLSEHEQTYNFNDMFVEVLSIFNQPENFNSNKYQDELVGRMSQIFECSYDLMAFEFSDKDKRQPFLDLPPQDIHLNEENIFSNNNIDTTVSFDTSEQIEKELLTIPPNTAPAVIITRTSNSSEQPSIHRGSLSYNDNKEAKPKAQISQEEPNTEQFINAHIISPIEKTERLQAIEGMVEKLSGERNCNFETNVLESIPIQVGCGLYPISDLWYIDPMLDNVTQLKVHIGQLALEIAEDMGCANAIETTNGLLGFNCIDKHSDNQTIATLLSFFNVLVVFKQNNKEQQASNEMQMLVSLLTGIHSSESKVEVLNDVAFVKLMRIFRLVRRLIELQQTK